MQLDHDLYRIREVKLHTLFDGKHAINVERERIYASRRENSRGSSCEIPRGQYSTRARSTETEEIDPATFIGIGRGADKII